MPILRAIAEMTGFEIYGRITFVDGKTGKKMLMDLLMAVIAAAVPVLTTFFVKYINQKKAELSAQTDNTKWQWYIRRYQRRRFGHQPDLCGRAV